MASAAGLQHKLAFPGERAELWAQVIGFCQVRDIPGSVGGAEVRWGIRRAVLCAAALSPKPQSGPVGTADRLECKQGVHYSYLFSNQVPQRCVCSSADGQREERCV